MTIHIAINGYGRIGHNVLRAHCESGKIHDIEMTINDLGDAQPNAHLTHYDTTHVRFAGSIVMDDDHLVVNGDRLKVLAERTTWERKQTTRLRQGAWPLYGTSS